MKPGLRLLSLSILAMCCLSMAWADEEKTEAKKPAPTKKIDWGKYVDAGKISGEIERVSKDQSEFKLKVTKVVPTMTRGRPGVPKAKTEVMDFIFHEEGLVRWGKLPKKVDLAGKKINWTSKEMTDFKLPPGIPGYATERSTLADGHLVEVVYARPKDLKPADLVSSDYRVKYVVILSEPEPISPLSKEIKESKGEEKSKDK